jgi:hypothetical protein
MILHALLFVVLTAIIITINLTEQLTAITVIKALLLLNSFVFLNELMYSVTSKTLKSAAEANLNNSVHFTEGIPTDFSFNLRSQVIEARWRVCVFFEIIIVTLYFRVLIIRIIFYTNIPNTANQSSQTPSIKTDQDNHECKYMV